MKLFYVIVSVIFLLIFDAFAQIPSDANLRIQINSLSETNFSGTISNTQPDIQYEVQRRQDRTNWVSMGFVLGSETTNWTAFDFRTTNAVNSKTIRVRSWIDSDGSGISDWWQLRYFGNVGVDPYGNPEGDGWNNLQKFQNDMDPFDWYRPTAPQQLNLTFRPGMDVLHNNGILSWQYYNGPTPDFFIIERANRTLPLMTNNWSPYHYVPNGKIPTNRPPLFRPPYGRPRWPTQEPFVTGSYEVIAQVPGQPDVREYHYTDTNIDAFPSPVYRIQAHFTEPALFPKLTTVTTETVRKTILPVTAKQETNGYALTVLHPALHVRYLLLVRDKNDKQWRASGYFVSSTNGNPVYLQVDKKGMMTDAQSPISMPPVKFLADVVKPEFTAGYGEDSDGDYLPDIYEVLVTHTDPANDDTGDTGIIDGCKEMTGDGWSNLDKFHCRVDPLHPAKLPPTVELKHPTRKEILEAVTPTTDLNCELQIEVRTNGSREYQPIEEYPWIFHGITDFRRQDELTNFDLRISWHFATPTPSAHEYDPFGRETPYRAFELLIQKVSLHMAEAFKANLETNPPLSQNDFTNKMMAILKNRTGQSAIEFMALEDNQSQDFYGKVIDQFGQPVVGATVTLNINLNLGTGSTHKVQTDANGLFQFMGLRGKSLNITPEKNGFQITNHGQDLDGLNGHSSDPQNPVIFHLRKKGEGAELITSENGMRSSVAVRIPKDNTPVRVDFFQKQASATGQLEIRQIKPSWQRATNWSFSLSIPDSGLVENQDEFQFEAPEAGYQPTVEYSFTKGETNWTTQVTKQFYIAFGQPRKYGWLRIESNLAQETIFLTYAINPSGSRNLEPK